MSRMSLRRLSPRHDHASHAHSRAWWRRRHRRHHRTILLRLLRRSYGRKPTNERRSRISIANTKSATSTNVTTTTAIKGGTTTPSSKTSRVLDLSVEGSFTRSQPTARRCRNAICCRLGEDSGRHSHRLSCSIINAHR